MALLAAVARLMVMPAWRSNINALRAGGTAIEVDLEVLVQTACGCKTRRDGGGTRKEHEDALALPIVSIKREQAP